MTAKPTIDVLLEINENADIEKFKEALSSSEYICLCGAGLTMPTPPPHLMFLKGYMSDGFAEKVCHIHVVYPGDNDELRCRVYLIAYPEAAAEYAELKRRLFKDYKHDRDGYTEAKTQFLQTIARKRGRNDMNLSKSIDFLLENAGAVIQYRLRKEILNSLTQTDEDNWLEKIYQTPNFKLFKTYVKPNGYVGSGAHSWDNWRGTVLHETPLQDGEAAARLLSYYAIPKTHPIVANFVTAMRDDDILRKEFSYIPPEVERFNNRFRGINNGFCLMTLMYTMQAMFGYGDDEYVKPFQNTALEAFRSILPLSSPYEITKTRQSKAKYNYPYIEENTYFPGQYHLETLAYTSAWRTPENVKLIADALNHYNEFMPDGFSVHVKIGNKYIVPAPLNMGNRPVRPFRTDVIESITYRRLLTEIAMLGVGESVGVIKKSVENVEEAINNDGILEMRFDTPHNKRYSPKMIEYPTPYVDVRLEAEYKRKYALECDLTFWAVQFLHLVKGAV